MNTTTESLTYDYDQHTNFFPSDKTVQTLLIVMAALTPLLGPLVCLCQFYTRKYASRATATLYETDNTDTILTGCGWCCLLVGMSCLAAFLATAATGDSVHSAAAVFQQQQQQHDFTYYGPMRWTNVTIRHDTFRASCSDPSLTCRRRNGMHQHSGGCCLYHSFVPELHLEFGYEWACADNDEVKECFSEVPLEACKTVVCSNESSPNCSEEQEEASYHTMMNCVEQQHSTSIQLTTTANNNSPTDVFEDVALSNDPPRNDDDNLSDIAPDPDQEPTWLAYGNCHSCQAQLALPMPLQPQLRHHDRHKLQRIGRILSFLGVASLALGLCITLMYSMYLMGKRQQDGRRSNSNQHHHHHYRQHQVVPVAKKCQLIELDESERAGEDGVHVDNNDMLDRAAETAHLARVLQANTGITTMTSSSSSELYSSKELQDETV